MEKVKQGNQQALRMIIERYKGYLFKIIYNVVRDETEAEDLTQETFIKMVDALPDYEAKGFKTWLSRIAYHKAIDAKRKRNRRHEELTEGFEWQSTPSDSAEDDWLQQQKQNKVVGSIQKLPQGYRGVVHAYYIEGKSYSIIAHEQCLAEKTVEMRLYRARKWMKNNWEEDEF
nr:sigma-70 family RNA polymerase sigma factor [Pontibacillus yanchengensis]